MMTDTLIETTWIKHPDRLHVVCFTDWQQADALRELVGASGFNLHVSLTRDEVPQQFYIEFLFDKVSLRGLPKDQVAMNQGDYLATIYEIATEGDPPRPAEDQSIREWRVMTDQQLREEYQRYHEPRS